MPTIDRSLPNRRLRRVLLAAQEVMGRNGLNATLKLAGLSRYANAFPPDNRALEINASEYAALNRAIELQFGSSARGQLGRIGQATFRQILAADKGTWRSLAFINRILPPRQRLRRALELLAKHLAEPDGKVGVYSDDQRLLFVDEAGDSTFGRERAAEMCWLTIGQLQECVSWVTTDAYEIAEVACKAKGDASCKFEIVQV
jgi:hypothetical protein